MQVVVANTIIRPDDPVSNGLVVVLVVRDESRNLSSGTGPTSAGLWTRTDISRPEVAGAYTFGQPRTGLASHLWVVRSGREARYNDANR